MTSFERGDIVLVPFPFSDQTTAKKRPAVVISSASHDSLSADRIIMAVTSQTGKVSTVGECLIEDWKNAGLLKPSAIKSAISTIEKSLILKKLGKLSPSDISAMDKALKDLLDLG